MTTLFPNPSQTSLPLNPTPPPTPSLNLDSSTFVEIASRGPGFSPLTFDDPTFYGGTRLDNVTIFNPNDQTYKKFNNVLTRTDWNGQQSAYYIHRLLKKCIYGKVTLAVVLVPHEVQPANPTRDPNAPPLSQSNNFSINNVVWRFTTEFVAIKQMLWGKVREFRKRNHQEDPIKEISAMQTLTSDGTITTADSNICLPIETLSDDRYIYCIMPNLRNGELFDHVARGRFSEDRARFWFRQIIQALIRLQQKGICHRDMSLENVMVDDNQCIVIDFGMCLRVPYNSGGQRLLMLPQGQCGKFNYMSPEVFQNRESFDGFAIDIWACGVILFAMTMGVPAFDRPIDSDPRFIAVKNGQLLKMVRNWGLVMSDSLGDLIQKMLMVNPNQRICLKDIIQHEWFSGPIDEPPPPPPTN